MMFADINATSVRKMRTSELAQAKREAAEALRYARAQINTAYHDAVKHHAMGILTEAKDAWNPIIQWREEEIKTISEELDRRQRNR